MGVQRLSELQLELLKIYSFEPSNEDLVQIKLLLGKYFAKKLNTNVQKAIEEKNIVAEDLERWLNEKD